jgi:hypothetical protein
MNMATPYILEKEIAHFNAVIKKLLKRLLRLVYHKKFVKKLVSAVRRHVEKLTIVVLALLNSYTKTMNFISLR